MPRNLADESQVKDGARKGKLIRDRELLDVRSVLDLEQGRRLIWRYLTLAGVFQTSFTGDNATFFNEGRRDIGLKILGDVMEAKPEAYIQMSQDAAKNEEITNA